MFSANFNFSSPYWVFVCEFGKKMGRKGIYNDNQLKEMASSKWNGMTQEEKNKYKVMAKASEPTLNQKRRIYNTLGQDVEKVEEENQRKKKETQSMKDEVRKLATDANNSGGILPVDRILSS